MQYLQTACKIEQRSLALAMSWYDRFFLSTKKMQRLKVENLEVLTKVCSLLDMGKSKGPNLWEGKALKYFF